MVAQIQSQSIELESSKIEFPDFTATISEHLEWPSDLTSDKFWVVNIEGEGTRMMWLNSDDDCYELMSKKGKIIKSTWRTTHNNRWFKALGQYQEFRAHKDYLDAKASLGF